MDGRRAFMKLHFSTLATAALLAVSIATLSKCAEARGLGGFGMHGGFGHVGGWGRPGWGWGWPIAAGVALGVAATAPWGYYGGYGYPGYYAGYAGYYGYYGSLGRCGYGGCSYNY